MRIYNMIILIFFSTPSVILKKITNLINASNKYDLVSKIMKILEIVLSIVLNPVIKAIIFVVHKHCFLACKIKQMIKFMIKFLYKKYLLPIIVQGGLEYKKRSICNSFWQRVYKMFAKATYNIYIFIEENILKIQKNICFIDICEYLGFPSNLEYVDMMNELDRTRIIQDSKKNNISSSKKNVKKEKRHTNNDENNIPKKNYNSILKKQKNIQKTVKINEIPINNNEITDKEKLLRRKTNEKKNTVPHNTTHDLENSNDNIFEKIQDARNKGDITSMSTSEILAFHIVDDIFDGVSFLD